METLKRTRLMSNEEFSPKKVDKNENYNSPSKRPKNSSTVKISPQKNCSNFINKKQPEMEEIDDLQKWFNNDNDDDHFTSFNDENSLQNNENLPSNCQHLNLTNWTRCIIQQIERDSRTFDLILSLQDSENSSKISVCRLQGPWCHTKIQEKDLICIKGIWDPILNCYVVNVKEGFIITNPDYLISGTSVVGSLFCLRRGVLQDKFRGLDADNKMVRWIINYVTTNYSF